MPLIDRSYFIGEINIPNTSTTAIGELLDWFIEKYEPELLTDVLGYELYKAFSTGLEEDAIEQKWTDLLEGKEYTDISNKIRKWNGLIDEDKKLSLIANYVYYRFIQNNTTQTASMGEVKSVNENAIIASPSVKLVKSWNEMSKNILELKDFLDANKEEYPEWENHSVWCVLNKFRMTNVFGI
jgi:hypothetical protein